MYLMQFCGAAVGLNLLVYARLRGRDHGIKDENQRARETDAFRLLVGMISVFVITILPDTITTIIYYVPSIDCCGSSTMCVIHDFMKFSTIVGPIVWGTVCQSFRDAIWGVVRCRSVDKVGE
ncbi:uncharacterized protein [Fopius arisanus]|uniref:Uncharacterized protein isoform X1 n=1 Tax=Fopius arisanus TaxID=64838 RepID=A0A9R1TC31_9HYME|nr:PREDICTED: uncharacterized protein LOC105268487 isoform X1 [Fopius arisanus]